MTTELKYTKSSDTTVTTTQNDYTVMIKRDESHTGNITCYTAVIVNWSTGVSHQVITAKLGQAKIAVDEYLKGQLKG